MAYYGDRTHVVVLTLGTKLFATHLGEPFPVITVLPAISDVASFIG